MIIELVAVSYMLDRCPQSTPITTHVVQSSISYDASWSRSSSQLKQIADLHNSSLEKKEVKQVLHPCYIDVYFNTVIFMLMCNAARD